MTQVSRYTEQFSFVGTPTQALIIDKVIDDLFTDKAKVLRFLFNEVVGLTPASDLKAGDTVEEAATRLMNKINRKFSEVGLP